MLTKCCLFPVGFSVHLFSVCSDSLVAICTKLELILKVCFDSTFTQGEFNHVARVIHHGGGWHESNWSDQAEFTDGEAMPAKQNSPEGQVKHWRCALHTAGWLAARPFGECMNLMQVGFKIIKCMIYWKKSIVENNQLTRWNEEVSSNTEHCCDLAAWVTLYLHSGLITSQQSICFQFPWFPKVNEPPFCCVRSLSTI